jgi:LPS export ABC transporter protein LptC
MRRSMRAIRALRGWAAAALAAGAAACGGGGDPTAPAVLDLEHQQATFGMNLKLTENGVLRADVYADTAFAEPGSSQTELRNVRLTFFGEEGERRGTLTSTSGQYDQRSNLMIARGRVVLVVEADDDGGQRTVRTEELYYDQNGDRVWSEVPTSIEREGEILYADSFTANTAFTDIRGRNATTSEVRVGDGGLRL